MLEMMPANDSDDDAEAKEEERESAREAFLALSTQENGHEVIAFSQLEELFSNLNCTYCEEEYGD